MKLLLIIAAIILVEAITELFTKSEILSPLRELFFNRKQYKVFDLIHRILDCSYCSSVWTGWFIALLFFRGTDFISPYIDWFFIGLVLHRSANLLHHVIDRLDRYKKVDI